MNELIVLVNSEIFKPQVIAVTEIKHKSKWNLLNSELNIEGYALYANVAIPVQLHSFLNRSCTADHHDISRIQIYSFKVD